MKNIQNVQMDEFPYAVLSCDDDEEMEEGISAFGFFCLIVLGIIITVVLAIAVGLYFLIDYIRWGNGLQLLIPAFFLFICYEIFQNYYDEIPYDEEDDDLDD